MKSLHCDDFVTLRLAAGNDLGPRRFHRKRDREVYRFLNTKEQGIPGNP